MSCHKIVDLKNAVLANTFLALVFFGLMFPVTPAVAFDCYGIDVVDYGIYETDFINWESAPKTDLGKIEMVSGKRLLRLTAHIPAKKGTQFGMRYVLNGEPEGEDVPILVKVSHSTTVNKKEIPMTNEWVTTKKIGSTAFDGWKFNAESDLARGNWTIQIYYEGMKLAEKRFYAY